MICDCCGEDCGPVTRHDDLTEGEEVWIGAGCEALGREYTEACSEEVEAELLLWEGEGGMSL